MNSLLKPWLNLLCLLTLGAFCIFGQEPGPGGPPPGGPDGPMGPPADQQQQMFRQPGAKQLLDRFTKTLKLSDSQRTSVKPILETRDHELAELRKANDGNGDGTKDIASIDDKSWMAMRPLLNDKQQKKFDSMIKAIAERRDRAAARRDGDEPPAFDGPPPDGPPPGGGGPPLD